MKSILLPVQQNEHMPSALAGKKVRRNIVRGFGSHFPGSLRCGDNRASEAVGKPLDDPSLPSEQLVRRWRPMSTAVRC